MQDKTERKQLISAMLDIGEDMLCSGAEISRVEDTLMRIGKAYNAATVSVFGLSSNILVTVEFDDGDEYTKTRRIYKAYQNDFTKLEALNALSRKFSLGDMSVADLHNEYMEISQLTPPSASVYLGSALAGASFAMFFGGNIYDFIFAGFIGLLICFMQNKMTPVCKNGFTFTILASFISGLVILLIAEPFPIFNPDKIMIGDIMLLVPGIAITNSVRDIFVGDTITGAMRFLESLLNAGALAVGFVLAIVASSML